MSELGRLLAEARAASGEDLAEAEAATRIRQKYLEALEAGDYAALPLGAVARGFVRIYARHLGIDEVQALSLYMAESGDSNEEFEIAEPGQPRLIDYRPLEVELMDTRPPGWVSWVAAAFLLLALGALAWWLIGRDRNDNPQVAALLPPTAQAVVATAADTATPWVVTATFSPQPIPELVQPTATSDLLTLPIPTAPPTLTPTPRPTPTPEIVPGIAMSMTATMRSWVRVVVDGAIAQEGIMLPGQERFWEAGDAITVRTGNAGGLSLVLNGEELGSMGAVGEVVERTWAVDQGDVTEAQAGQSTPGEQPTSTPTSTPAG